MGSGGNFVRRIRDVEDNYREISRELNARRVERAPACASATSTTSCG